MASLLSIIRRMRSVLSPQPRDLRRRYPQYSIGPGTYGSLEVKSWGEGTTLRVGAYSSFAHGVKIFLGGEHRPDWVTTYPFSTLWPEARHIAGHPATKGDVSIGNDVWVGTDAIITSGVTVGDGAVIGAGAVVTKDVPPYAIVAGNPARIVRYRFDDSTIAELLKVCWWEWDEDTLRRALPDLLSTDLARFLHRARANTYLDRASAAHGPL